MSQVQGFVRVWRGIFNHYGIPVRGRFDPSKIFIFFQGIEIIQIVLICNHQVEKPLDHDESLNQLLSFNEVISDGLSDHGRISFDLPQQRKNH